MNEEKLEKISALMDGELTGRERDVIIEGIEEDPDTRGSWERYHMIGDTMRSTMPRAVDPDLASRLNSMLDHEPTIIAPRPKQKLTTQYMKPLMGLAIAASVTAIAVLGIQTSKQQTPGIDSLEGALPQVAITDSELIPIPVIEQPAEPTLVNASSVRTVKYEPNESNVSPQQLNRYIMNHNQHNSRMGMQGVSPQARLVGHEGN